MRDIGNQKEEENLLVNPSDEFDPELTEELHKFNNLLWEKMKNLKVKNPSKRY